MVLIYLKDSVYKHEKREVTCIKLAMRIIKMLAQYDQNMVLICLKHNVYRHRKREVTCIKLVMRIIKNVSHYN